MAPIFFFWGGALREISVLCLFYFPFLVSIKEYLKGKNAATIDRSSEWFFLNTRIKLKFVFIVSVVLFGSLKSNEMCAIERAGHFMSYVYYKRRRIPLIIRIMLIIFYHISCNTI